MESLGAPNPPPSARKSSPQVARRWRFFVVGILILAIFGAVQISRPPSNDDAFLYTQVDVSKRQFPDHQSGGGTFVDLFDATPGDSVEQISPQELADQFRLQSDVSLSVTVHASG